MGSVSGCGDLYRSLLSHRTVPHPTYAPRGSGVRGWTERYLATHDAAALADRPRRGRPHSAPQLTPRCLTAALARDPRGCGYQATSWTVPLLRHDLQQRHGITVSARTLRRRLHEVDYRWKRPRYVY